MSDESLGGFFSHSPLGWGPFLMAEHREVTGLANARRRTSFDLPKANFNPRQWRCQCYQKRFCAKNCQWTGCQMNPWSDVFLIPTWAGAILDGRTSKKRPSDDWKTNAAGQILTSLLQTSIPGNVNANANRKKRKSLPWGKVSDKSLAAFSSFPTRAGAILDG